MSNSPLRTKKDVHLAIRRNSDKVKSFGVKKLDLFGSFVREEQNSDSDVDLLVEFEEGQRTFDNLIHLSFWLEEQLEHPIELVTIDSISPYIRPYIAQEVEYVSLST